MESQERLALQYYRSVDHAVDVFTTFFGPTARAAEGADEETRENLRADVRAVFEKYNGATDGTAVIENRYRMTLATCR